MSVSDIFKKSFLEGFESGDITFIYICSCLAITAAISLYIFFAHRVLTRKSFYDKNFGVSLCAMSLITAAIVITIQSSVVVSLGMVGALSIVRFRNAVKNPMDLVYLFWSISIGIICGAGFAETAILLSLVVTVVLIVLELIPVAKAPMILVINADNYENDTKIIETVKKYSKYNKIKSRNLSAGHLDMVIEVRIDKEGDCVKELMAIPGVISASLLSHDGEVTF